MLYFEKKPNGWKEKRVELRVVYAHLDGHRLLTHIRTY